jgi:hypothetical protein
MCHASRDFRKGMDAFLTRRPRSGEVNERTSLPGRAWNSHAVTVRDDAMGNRERLTGEPWPAGAVGARDPQRTPIGQQRGHVSWCLTTSRRRPARQRAYLSGDDLFIAGGGARGPARSRNLGLAAAESDYVLFLDDDEWPPGFLAALNAADPAPPALCGSAVSVLPYMATPHLARLACKDRARRPADARGKRRTSRES